MGCSGSKVDDLPLVTLCRERKNLIRAASENRYALAAAHITYFQSLASVGEALCKFVEEELVIGANSGSYPSSPVLTLPSDERKPRRSSGKVKNSSSATSITHSASHHEEREANGSHLQLSGSDSDSDSNLSSHSGHIHVHDSPPVRKSAGPRHFPDPGPSSSYGPSYPYPPYENPYPNPNHYSYPNPYPNPYSYPQGEWGMPNMATPEISESQPRMYYMKKSATPMKSVIFEEPERYSVRENESWSRYENSGYPQYGNGGGYFGYPMSNGGSGYGVGNGREQQKQEQPPPAPPSPPRVSPWEYLNVFETYGTANAGYYPPGSTGSRTSSPDSAEVREREGIPDLEDETESEMMKVVHKDRKRRGKNIMQKKNFNNIPSQVPLQRNFEGPSNFGPSNFASQQNEGYEKAVPSMGSESSHPTFAKEMESISSEEVLSKGSARKGVSFEVEEALTEEIESMKPTNVTTLSANGTRELQEVVQEIKDEFETAYGYGKEVAFLLEVGKLPYQSKDTLLKVLFSRIMYLVAPSMVSSEPPFEPAIRVSPRTMKMAKAYSTDAAKDELMSKSGNISSTLEKLYVWERKLHKEVKDEEKLRVVYMKQCKKLKSLDEKGAEAAKIDATRDSIRNLHTKINVSLRTVNAISNRIHKVRDEELQPQLIELIHGLIRMWRSMFKCHQKQFQAIMESKASSLRAKRESSLQATLELELELLNWCESFNQWVTTQRSYVESLNEWLLRCLNREPEETADGVAPFSPSRMGAPPIFVICNDWFQAMERISQERVSNAMREFASRLHELWERQDDKTETLSKDLEKQLRVLRMEKNGKLKSEKNSQDAGSDKTVVSHLDDLKVDLDSMRKKMEEERERHKEAVKLVRGSSSVKSGLVPIFETLGRFSSEVLEGYEHVRIGS